VFAARLQRGGSLQRSSAIGFVATASIDVDQRGRPTVSVPVLSKATTRTACASFQRLGVLDQDAVRAPPPRCRP
jgi:hypothetical protein